MKQSDEFSEKDQYEDIVFPSLRSELIFKRQFFKREEYYVIKDPLSLTYFRLQAPEVFLVQVLDGKKSLREVNVEFLKEFPNQERSCKSLFLFFIRLKQLGLLSVGALDFLKVSNDKNETQLSFFDLWAKFISKILFIKIPLLDPSPWLGSLTDCFRFMWSVPMVIFCLLFFVFSGVRLFLNSSDLDHNSISFFSSYNLFLIWVCMIFIKTCHEFGHAMTCKRFGGEVHEMGVCLICLFVCGYVNASDAWMMRYQRHKIYVTISGIFVEFILASIAVHVWLMLPDGLLRNLAFNAMIIASINTFVFNMNPLMKFDGYYVISDLLEIPNLRTKAIMYCSMHIQRLLFGYRNTRQEEALSGEKHGKVFVVYAVCSYVYMTFIIYGLFQVFARYLEPYGLREFGLIIGGLGQGTFFVYPVFRVFYDAFRPGAHIIRVEPLGKCVGRWVFRGACVTLVILVLPTRYKIDGQGVLLPLQVGTVTSLHGGFLDNVYVNTGDWVDEGQVLGVLRNKEIQKRYRESNLGLDMSYLKFKKTYGSFEEFHGEGRVGAIDNIDLAASEVGQRLGDLNELNLVAPVSGYIVTKDLKRNRGRYYKAEEIIIEVENSGLLKLVFPVLEDQVELLKQGSRVSGKIIGDGRRFSGLVTKIIPQRQNESRLHLAISALFGGPFSLSDSGSGLSSNIYLLESSVEDSLGFFKDMRARGKIFGLKTTLGKKLWRQFLNFWNLRGPTRNSFEEGPLRSE